MSARPFAVQAEAIAAHAAGEENWRAKLAVKPDGRPKPLLLNAMIALRDAPEWRGVLAFDEFALRTITTREKPWGAPAGGWLQADDLRTAEWLQKKGVEVNLETAGQAVQAIAAERQVHPLRAWLKGLQWDGEPRIDRWLSTYCGASETAYTAAVGARWLISAVARVMQPGCKADHMLILEGKQGIGKSRALRALAGEYFTDEIPDLNSKDAAVQVAGVWIVELSELDALSRADASAVKAFVSRQIDRYRPPYGKRADDVPRQAVFAGTTNTRAYLKDETGGRRFWPIECGLIDPESIARDREQIWAEATERFHDHCPWWLVEADLIAMAAEQQADRYEGDAWLSEIEQYTGTLLAVQVGEVLGSCLKKEKGQWSRADEMRVAKCLKRLGFERKRLGKGWEYQRERLGEMEVEG